MLKHVIVTCPMFKLYAEIFMKIISYSYMHISLKFSAYEVLDIRGSVQFSCNLTLVTFVLSKV